MNRNNLSLDDFKKLYEGLGDIYIESKYRSYLELIKKGISLFNGFFDLEVMEKINIEAVV